MADRPDVPTDGTEHTCAEQDDTVRILDSTEHRTAAGTAFLRFDGRVGEARFYAHAPLNRDGAPVAEADLAVLHFHGSGASRTNMDNREMCAFRDAALDRGWVLGAPSTGNAFGNPDALALGLAVLGWLRSEFTPAATVLHGYSMGGMAAYNASGRGLVPDLAGVVVVNGTVDSLASNSLPAIREAYGALDDAELLRLQAGFDPARDDPARWAGLPMFLSYSTGDAAVPAQRHGEVFMGRAATPECIVYRVGTNGHADVSGFRHPEVLDWIGSLPPLASR